MRILLLSGEHPDLPGLTGGIGSYVADASRALAAAGHDVHVLVCAPGLRRVDLVGDGVHLHGRGVLPLLRPARGRVARQVAIAASCWWHARSFGAVDVVDAPEWQALAAGFALHRATPLVVTIQTPSALVAAHDAGQPSPARANDWLERWVVRRADLVISLSHLLVDELRRLGWLDAEREVAVTPPLVHLDDWRSGGGEPTTRPTLLGIGRIEPRKGFELLVDAAAVLRRDIPDLAVEIAGEPVGENGSRLERHADRLGVALRLLGRRDRADLAALAAAAGVVVLPSTFDSFNMAGLEALAAGAPVVVSDRVGLGELADGTTALQVVERTPEAIAGAVRPLLTDDAARASAGSAARALAARVASPGVFAQDRAGRYAQLRVPAVS